MRELPGALLLPENLARGIAFRMQETENCRDENQSGDGGEEQTADNGAARGAFCSPPSPSRGHGDHADDHGESGHEDGGGSG